MFVNRSKSLRQTGLLSCLAFFLLSSLACSELVLLKAGVTPKPRIDRATFALMVDSNLPLKFVDFHRLGEDQVERYRIKGEVLTDDGAVVIEVAPGTYCIHALGYNKLTIRFGSKERTGSELCLNLRAGMLNYPGHLFLKLGFLKGIPELEYNFEVRPEAFRATLERRHPMILRAFNL